MRVGFAGEDRLDVDSCVVVEEREDERRRAGIVEDDAADDVGAAVAEETGVGHLDFGGMGFAAAEYGLEPFRYQPHVARPVAPGTREARDVQDAVDERSEIQVGGDGKVDPHRGRTLGRRFTMVQKRVLHRLPHAFVHHPPRGVDVGVGEIGLVAAFDQREVSGLDPFPERLVLGGRRERFAQAPCERVHADAVDGEASQAEIQRRGGVAPLEGGLGEVGDAAGLDVVGVEFCEDPAGGEIRAFVNRARSRDAVCVVWPPIVHGGAGLGRTSGGSADRGSVSAVPAPIPMWSAVEPGLRPSWRS